MPSTPPKLPLRQGPRPLPLHLMAASSYYMSSIAASLALRSDSITWSAGLTERARNLAHQLQERRVQENPATGAAGGKAVPEANPVDAFAVSVEREVRGRLDLMLRGVQSYRHHPYLRPETPVTTLWSEGTTRLLDYRRLHRRPGIRLPVLLVPSLVNRAYILDLRPEHSFARHLGAAGHPVFLLDWDAPGEVEAEFDLGDYIARLRRAVAACTEATGTPVALIGYCMGGLLALPAALGMPDRIDALVLMATPWDFHAERPDQSRALAALLPGLEQVSAHTGTLPVDPIQALFAGLDPMLAIRKFARFAQLNPESAAAESFVALEDWLNDGVALSAPVMRDCIGGWYGRNSPARNQWRIDGLVVDPSAWDKPALCMIPSTDRIVPPESARALTARLPRCIERMPQVGHIGMMTARSAVRDVWDPILSFLDDPDGVVERKTKW